MRHRFIAAFLIAAAFTAVHADGKHEHAFAADVHAFHEQLAPLWHAPAGKARIDNTCKAAPELARLAAAIQSRDATALSKAIAQLQQECSNEPMDIEQAFSAVHDAFHQLIGDPAAR